MLLSENDPLSESATNELARLRQENSELSAKNMALQSKIDIANNISMEMETICNKNMALEKQMHDMNGKYDELSRRLKISQDKNSKLQSEIESLKMQSQFTASNQIEELTNNNQILENKVNDYRKEILNLKENLQKKESELNNLTNSVNRILQFATDYFQHPFSNISNFEEYLKKKKDENHYHKQQMQMMKEQEIQQQQLKLQQQCENDEEKVILCKTIKRLKKQNKALNQTLTDLQNQFSNDRREIQQKNDQAIKELKAELNNQKKETKKQADIAKELDEKNNDLLKQLSDQKTQHLLNQKQLNAQNEDEIRQLSDKISKLEGELRSEKDQNNANRKELNNTTCKYKSAQSALRIAKDELQETNRAKLEMKFNFDYLQSKYDDLVEQNKSLQDSLTEKEKTITEETEKNKYYKDQNIRLNEENESQNKQLIQQQEALQNKDTQIQQLNNDLNSSRNEMASQKKENEKLLSKIQKLQDEINQLRDQKKQQQQVELYKLQFQRQQQQNPDSLFDTQYNDMNQIPQSVFEVNDMPKDLNNLVRDIVQNKSLRLSAKIKNVLSIIIQWYNKQINETNKQSQEIQKTASGIDEILSTLASSLKNTFDMDITMDDLKNAAKVTLLQDRIQKQFYYLRRNEAETKQKESMLLDLLTLLNVSSIGEAQSAIKELIDHAKESYNKVLEIKQSNKDILAKSKERDEECRKQLDQLEKDASVIASRAEKVELEKKALENKIQDLEDQITQLKAEHAQELKTCNELQNEQIGECEKAVQRANSRTRDEIQKRKELEEQLLQSKNEKEKIHKSLQLLHSSKRKQDEEIDRLRSQIKATESTAQDKVNCIAKSLQRKYDTLLTQQRQESTESQNTIKAKNQKIEQLEKQNEELTEKNAALQLEMQKIEMRSQAAAEEQERSRKILESKLKTQLMSIESEYNLKLDTAQRQTDAVQRSLISKVGVEFCSLFNTSQTLNESNFEAFLQNLKSRFNYYIEEDLKIRTLLNVPPGQSISDAISSQLCC